MHACSQCGHEPQWDGARLLQDPRNGRDVGALRKEARRRGGDIGALLEIIADRLEAEDLAVDHFDEGLRETYEKVVEALDAATRARPGDLRRIAILNANADQLADMLEAAGLREVRIRLRKDLAALVEIANASPTVQGLPPGTVKLDSPAVRALLERTDETFFRGKIQQPAANLIREGLDRALTLEPLDKTVADIQAKLGTSVGRATSEARTQIATFDRFVNTQVARDAGLDKWYYAGPLDGLTRPFCRRLVGKVITAERFQVLDNGHGIGNPLTTGGGRNCRHRTAAVSDATIERRSMPLATAEDIEAANAAGAR